MIKILRWMGIHNMTVQEWIPYPNMNIKKMLNQGRFIRRNDTLSRRMVFEYLLKKFDYRCAYCGEFNDNFEVDHIIPKSRKGTENIYNLVLSCHECNLRKSTSSWIQFGFPRSGRNKTPNYDLFPLHMIRYRVDDEEEWHFGEKENDCIPFGFSFIKTKEKRHLIYKSRRKFGTLQKYGFLRGGGIVLFGRKL